jgi:hypothetical protein
MQNGRVAVGLGVLALLAAIVALTLAAVGGGRERAALDRFERAAQALEREPARGATAVRRLRAELANERDRSARIEAAFTEYKDLTVAGMAVTALLVAIAGILLPAIQYVSSILPGQKLLDRAENIERTLEDRFAELSARLAADQIDLAINNLTSKDPHERLGAMTHLSLNAHHPFSRHQVFEMVEAVRSETDLAHRIGILSLLARHRSAQVTRLLLELHSDPGVSFFQLLHPSILHVDLAEGPALAETLIRKGIETPGAGLQLLHMALNSAPLFFKRLVNDAEFIEKTKSPVLAVTVNNWLLAGLRSKIYGTKLGDLYGVHESA